MCVCVLTMVILLLRLAVQTDCRAMLDSTAPKSVGAWVRPRRRVYVTSTNWEGWVNLLLSAVLVLSRVWQSFFNHQLGRGVSLSQVLCRACFG